MKNNSIISIFNSLNKLYKIFCKKIFLNICYLSFSLLIVIALIFLFILIGTNGNNTTWCIWAGLSLLLVFLVTFYIFEFIRRRCKNELSTKCNLKNLYEQELISNKMIDNQLNSVDLKQHFLKFHSDSLLINFANSTLYTINNCYSFFINKTNYTVSTCFINNYAKSMNKQNDMQIIMSTQSNINVDDLYVTYKQESDSILNLRKFKDIDEYSIYSNTNIKEETIKKLTPFLKNSNDGYKLNIRIKDKTIYFIFILENRLFIDGCNLKLYKNNLDTINELWKNNLELFEKILEIIKDY